MSSKKTDIDVEDDDQAFQEDAGLEQGYAEVEQLVNARAHHVQGLLSRSDFLGAIRASLDSPPTGRAPAELKDLNTKTVMAALSTLRPNDIPEVIKSLSPAEVDSLVKYIYKGMASPEQYNSGLLLAWHEQAVKTAGLGSIVRVLTDRRTV
ncbi:actin-related protein 2/3 complex subunit 5 [Polychytrium aggregatum]|uniref:actin-related protein 2/3 complex subunit 5 n=1 Tax=Polychytrium aggregatum TaxID=110093 RepID=UPI0022FE36F8|nr:actin-related protein 2/3 complex subunit 5 [Polychytrium aggregatum]KAI9204741.1 actin-related protein 2/3 complex subunit 5 [Polychytrium aggregatum]